ncbi:4Fe-4S dicluster domain-containing protein [Thermodesulfobacteriota bacterium]
MLPHHKKIKDSLIYRASERPGYEKCNGCRVCTLPCPVWHQTHDMSLTLCGRARALQCGASPGDIRESIMACVLCGACESVCPFGIDTLGMTMDLRHMLDEKESTPSSGREAVPRERSDFRVYKRKIIPGRALRSDARLMNIIHDLFVNNETVISEDDGDDISLAVESGSPVSEWRKNEFTGSLAGAEELIVAEGILQRVLRKWMPLKITGLGMALLNKAGVRASLGPSDLYIIEASGYNSYYKDMVSEYDLIRRETGCQMNIDLHRSAIPTGSVSPGSNAVSPEEQARWIIKGRRFKRIIVESPEDIEIFKRVTDSDVIHVLELIKGDL